MICQIEMAARQRGCRKQPSDMQNAGHITGKAKVFRYRMDFRSHFQMFQMILSREPRQQALGAGNGSHCAKYLITAA